MCRINIILNTTTGDGSSIVDANGRYKLVNTSSWTTFTIDLSLPLAQTPDITQLGFYDLEVNVVNNIGGVSPWASSTFEISSDCYSRDELVVFGISCPLSQYNVSGARIQKIDVRAPQTLSWTATVVYLTAASTNFITLDTTNGTGSGVVIFDVAESFFTLGDIELSSRHARIYITNDADNTHTYYCDIEQQYYVSNSSGGGVSTGTDGVRDGINPEEQL